MNHVLELLYDGRIGRPDFADGSDAQKLYLQDSGIDWLVQENKMTDAQREDFLKWADCFPKGLI